MKIIYLSTLKKHLKCRQSWKSKKRKKWEEPNTALSAFFALFWTLAISTTDRNSHRENNCFYFTI